MHSYLKFLLITVLVLTHFVSGIRIGNAQYNAAYMQLGEPIIPTQYDSDLHLAQGAASVDLEPPLIEHEVMEEAEADIRQTFVASVVDDKELDRVVFFYRYAGESSFARYSMMQVSFSSTYIAQIPTNPKNLDAIEYYIQARDTSGNRTVRGYAFNPLVRQILPPAADPLASSNAGESAQASTAGGNAAGFSFSRLPKVVYVVGGVLLVGLIASAAGSSDNGSGGGRECDASGCRLTLTVNQP